MKKLIPLSLAASMVLAATAAADTQVTEKGVLSGDARVLYYSEDAATSENALGLGLNPTFTHDCLLTDNLVWELGAGVAIPLTESTEDVAAGFSMAKSPDTAGDGSEMYAALTKLNGTYDYGSGFVKVGYQLLETPMADSDDIRLVPNSYLAAIAAYTGISNVTLLAAQVAQQAGVVDNESAESPENYHSMSDVALGSTATDNDLVDDVGVTAIAAIYGNEDSGLNGQLWYYTMPDAGLGNIGAVSATYLDVGKSFGSVNVTAQYMTFATDLWSNSAMGLMAEMEAGDFGFTVAGNSFGFSDDGMGSVAAPAWYAWGGYPEFVAGEEVDASMADWDGGTAAMAAVGYNGIEKLGLTFGYFTYSDAVNAMDLVAEYELSESMVALAIYETKDFDDASGEEDTDTVELKLYYNF